MARYQYAGPGPIEILSGGGITRPGDVCEFEEEPTWGPWELLDGPDTEASPELTAAELGELKKEADAGLAAPSATSPFLTAPKEM